MGGCRQDPEERRMVSCSVCVCVWGGGGRQDREEGMVSGSLCVCVGGVDRTGRRGGW